MRLTGRLAVVRIESLRPKHAKMHLCCVRCRGAALETRYSASALTAYKMKNCGRCPQTSTTVSCRAGMPSRRWAGCLAGFRAPDALTGWYGCHSERRASRPRRSTMQSCCWSRPQLHGALTGWYTCRFTTGLLRPQRSNMQHFFFGAILGSQASCAWIGWDPCPTWSAGSKLLHNMCRLAHLCRSTLMPSCTLGRTCTHIYTFTQLRGSTPMHGCNLEHTYVWVSQHLWF